jgi:amino acid adenylation domain-containing protein
MRSVEPSREYWERVLGAGGFTAIPRWTLDPVPGVAGRETKLPEDLEAALRKRARELDVSLRSILLAAHARTLAALSGEMEVTTGYVPTGENEALPCRMNVETESWRTLLVDVHRIASELLSHKEFPVDGLKREVNVTGPLFETVFDPTGNVSDLTGENVLAVLVRRSGGRTSLRVLYRADVLDAECAARILSYHFAALRLIAVDPDAAHRRQSLLSGEERQFQIDGLAGPRRELPDSRVHELFERQAGSQPDAIAVVHGGRQLTYRELNTRANKVAHALITRGLRPESVVAVVTERNLNWVTAVLAIFKAGGVYLPIEPRFPAERIATTLSRAGCALVLTEPESDTTLDQALDSLPGIEKLSVHAALEENNADHDPGVGVAPEQLAYVYFTSGSTGEPKGAMCEHAGMLNHMLAKIEDLDIGAGAVVAQIAPQCFDISLWQMLAALLVGGRTLIIEQAAILDVQRFVDDIVDGEVTALQVVPSYLEVVLTFLEQHPRELTHLRCVSVTGEPLTMDLVHRWFATAPEIKLVNAYGLTETSDDTNHEVMSRPPGRDRVSLGPAIRNVHVYLVDEHLSPVPLGAPGEIVFSGVCVGRGYINDPERTQQAFVPDPVREGARLYRSGDYGRWQPDGKLEFLGRRDAQVKIRGFRVELGEIENKLLEIAGVSRCAVVVTEQADRSKHLVAFLSGERIDSAHIEERLRRSLPAYMVPSAYHWRESLPLTANGKTDKKVLAILARDLNGVGARVEAPATAAEERVAAAWAEVLGIAQDEIGRNDHFFDRGGTSLSAAKLVIALGRAVSLKDVIRHPVLADLAQQIESSSARPEPTRSLPEPGGSYCGANGNGHARPKRRQPPPMPPSTELLQ